MERTRLARNLVQAAQAFYRRALWQRLHSNQITAVHAPDQLAPVFASVTGAGGEPGLSVFRGNDALHAIQGLIAGHHPDDVMSPSDTLTLVFESPARIPAEYQVLLREAKFSGHPAPWFLSHPPGRQHRPTNRSENELLLYLLEGLLAADSRGLLRPEQPPLRGKVALWTLRLSGPPARVAVRAKSEDYVVATDARAAAPVVAPRQAHDLPQTTHSWWIAVPLIPGRITGDDRELRALLIHDRTADRIVTNDVVMAVDADQVAKAFFAACCQGNQAGPPGLPAHVDFDRPDLHQAMAGALARLGVSSACVAELPDVRTIVDEYTALNDGSVPGEDPASLDPAEHDLDGWKHIDALVTEELIELMHTGGDAATRAGARWFGPHRSMRTDDAPLAMACFAEWYACHWRTNARSRTAAERLLAEGPLPPSLEHLLRARASAPVALYRVRAITLGEGVELEDVLAGCTVRVHDRALSETAAEGTVFFGKVYAAGAFTFAAPLGPPLAVVHDPALQALEEMGLKLTPDDLQRTSHLIGRLWHQRAQPARAPKLTNTDGEPLLDIRASFAVRDNAGLRAALGRRPDVEPAGEDDEWIWFREKDDGSRLLLGRLGFVGGEVVATVNSEQRLSMLQQWLGALDGVRALGVTRRDMIMPPVDDRLPATAAPQPESPEMVTAAMEYMRTYYLRWLDEAIPALGGKTPRQAVKTPAGRRKVAMLIRTLSDPMGPAGPLHGSVPREEMLRELGLTDEKEREQDG